MLITLILCTYNRCGILPKALNSVVASIVPSWVEWEVLVVDNNSTDQTREVVEDFCQRYPSRFRYLLEPKQGLSRARNAGIRESRADVLAFTDDDVTVDPSWLWNLTASLCNSAWAGAAGRVLPLWGNSLPGWLSPKDPHELAPFVAFEPGSEADVLTEPPFGANMAFRKEMFEKYGIFRTDLGRCANDMLSNEDTEFGRRLLNGGERLRYEPSAVVYHPVAENRLRKEYLLKWWFGKGRSEIAELGIPQGTRWFLYGIPLYIVRRLVMWTLRWMIAMNPSKRFSGKRRVWFLAGSILECHQRSPATCGKSRAASDVRR